MNIQQVANVAVKGVIPKPKPATTGEVIFTSSRWTLRGDWRWRVGKDKSRNLRGPVGGMAVGRESDGFIVAKKCLIRMERREPTANGLKLDWFMNSGQI
ncbi:MAG: hypothetical protein EOM12_08040 [Verrucomicrobiae bacterium]|nr:hypothetical protein [Verrucomicrobiae bacterium]